MQRRFRQSSVLGLSNGPRRGHNPEILVQLFGVQDRTPLLHYDTKGCSPGPNTQARSISHRVTLSGQSYSLQPLVLPLLKLVSFFV